MTKSGVQNSKFQILRQSRSTAIFRVGTMGTFYNL